jgi:hypothetical protein
MQKTLPKSVEPAALPADEAAVVEEFTQVIRKHLNQGPASLARLARVALEFSLSPKQGARGQAGRGGRAWT